MSITVLCELRPHPGQAEAIVQRAIQQLSLPSSNVAGRGGARLYQHVDDPAWLLYLADWSSRTAFDAYRQTSPLPGTPDQFQQAPTCRYYRRLALFERVLIPVSTICVEIVDGPAETHAARRVRALAYHRSNVRNRPGLVLLQVYEASDHPPGLLIVSGWEASGQIHLPDRDSERAMRDVAAGGTTRRFIGRALAETTSN